jgi:hypothetical protein
MEEFEDWLTDLGTVVLTDELKKDILEEVQNLYYRANVEGFEEAKNIALNALNGSL